MRLLLLAGTAEARQIAMALAGQTRTGVIASLAGTTLAPRSLGVPTRIGGFGGREGFRDWLLKEDVAGVLDATHPFANQMSNRSAEVCAELGVPYLQFLRPPWMPREGDNWVFLNRAEEAAEHIPEGATALLAVGWKELDGFANLTGRTVYSRQIDPPTTPFPLPGGQYIVGRPPHAVADERKLFKRLGIEWLVVKNSGGRASRAKLDAARELGIPVAMIRRPPQPEAPRVSTVAAALTWARSLG